MKTHKKIPILLLLILWTIIGCGQGERAEGEADHLKLRIDDGDETPFFVNMDSADLFRSSPPGVDTIDWLQHEGRAQLPILVFAGTSTSKTRIRLYMNGENNAVTEIQLDIPNDNKPIDATTLGANILSAKGKEWIYYNADPSQAQTADVSVVLGSSITGFGKFDLTLCRSEAKYAETCHEAGNRKRLRGTFVWTKPPSRPSPNPPPPSVGSPTAPLDLGPANLMADYSPMLQAKRDGNFFRLDTDAGKDLEFELKPFGTDSVSLYVYADRNFKSELCHATATSNCRVHTTGNQLYLQAITTSTNDVFFYFILHDRTAYPELDTVDLRQDGAHRYQGHIKGKSTAFIFKVDPNKTYTASITTPKRSASNASPPFGFSTLYDLRDLVSALDRRGCLQTGSINTCIREATDYTQPLSLVSLPTLCQTWRSVGDCSANVPSGELMIYITWWDWMDGREFTVSLTEGGVAHHNQGDASEPLPFTEDRIYEVAAAESYYSIPTVPNQIYVVSLKNISDPYVADRLEIFTDAWDTHWSSRCKHAEYCAFRAYGAQTRIIVSGRDTSNGAQFQIDLEPNDQAIVSESLDLSDTSETGLAVSGMLSHQGTVGIDPSRYFVNTVPGATYIVTTTSSVDVLSFYTGDCTSRFVTASVARCVFQASGNNTVIAVHRTTQFGHGEKFTLDIVRDDSAQGNP